MAEDLDDGEFWLPSHFLADDTFMEKKNRAAAHDNSLCFPDEFPYWFGSALSSPVESVVGSTETESDEEDYLAGLTRQMAHTMLQEEEKLGAFPAYGKENSNTKVLASSPQSTLCAVGSWSGCSHGSSRGSSNGPSQVSSPPSTPLDRKDDAWDLLYAAAGQVVRMKMNDEVPKFQGRGLLGPPRKPAPPATSGPLKTPCAGYYSNQVLAHQQMQSSQFQQLKQQQQLMKQQQQQQQQCSVWGRQEKVVQPQQQLQSRASVGGFGNGRSGRPLGLSSSAWPPLQQQQQQPQAGSGMRAVFLGGTGSRRESCGTGVFLPRRAGNPTDTRKKPACSTVLLPARVVQALNLNLDEMGTAQPRFQGGAFLHHLDHEAMVAARSNPTLLTQQQKRNNSNIRPTPIINTNTSHHEIRLPQEWTY
ncbi:uncharacterized protein LOC131252727 [Magnolia sinica]|uniref:uncharacterized protein LOC131252727 n=1 Tax=Magnolia sinica TaxID=86752 RepID=UPI00265A6287|nr:uncharacterized protein LOC131252727 [Magnolia sinica]